MKNINFTIGRTKIVLTDKKFTSTVTALEINHVTGNVNCLGVRCENCPIDNKGGDCSSPATLSYLANNFDEAAFIKERHPELLI